MAGDSFKKVRPREALRIPAAAYNAFIDAARAHREGREMGSRDAGREVFRGALIPILNTTGATIPRFGILGIDAPLFDPGDAPEAFRRRVALRGVTPTAADHSGGKFVVALEPIPAGRLAVACGAGLCAARVEFPTDDGRERRFADVADGVTANLMAGDRGSASILWREPGATAGVKWAIIRLGGASGAGVFPVRLELASGAQGSALVRASWNYDVVDALTDEVLAEVVDPLTAPHHWGRPTTGPVSPATFGTAHFNADGDIELGWINETPQPMWVFPITLVQSGGQQGTPSAPASWQYAVYDATSGFTLGTSINPVAAPHQWRRPATGKVDPATHGYASISSAGLLIIGWINEVPHLPALHAFPISLVLAELANGTATAPTSHMYHVFEVSSGVQVGSFVNPGVSPHQWRRPGIGRYSPATFGLAYRNAAGDVIITWTNEAPELEACGTTGVTEELGGGGGGGGEMLMSANSAERAAAAAEPDCGCGKGR
ncbi:MAG: hypothetical protein JNK58_12020 [Phycisphaerae bacterium]|nr:hypothetical protein [Phycisphaerae bacterium]